MKGCGVCVLLKDDARVWYRKAGKDMSMVFQVSCRFACLGAGHNASHVLESEMPLPLTYFESGSLEWSSHLPASQILVLACGCPKMQNVKQGMRRQACMHMGTETQKQ